MDGKEIKKVTVFGGAGFMGQHLVNALSGRCEEIVVFDRQVSNNLPPMASMIVGDILDFTAVTEAIKGSDLVFNLAGLADIDECINKPVEAVTTNILGTVNLLQACVKLKVRRFIFSSTLYVYSRVGGIYRATKKACEELIEEYSQQFGLTYTILRFGTIYGPNSNLQNSIYRYLTQALETGVVEFPGNGQEMREYIHVFDAVEQTISLAINELPNRKFLITGNHPTRAADLFELIGEVIGKKIDVNYNPEAEGHSSHYQISPYAYREDHALKISNPQYIDLGQGILDLVHHLQSTKT